MIDVVDNICANLVNLILPLVGFRIIFDYTRIILFKD